MESSTSEGGAERQPGLNLLLFPLGVLGDSGFAPAAGVNHGTLVPRVGAQNHDDTEPRRQTRTTTTNPDSLRLTQNHSKI